MLSINSLALPLFIALSISSTTGNISNMNDIPFSSYEYTQATDTSESIADIEPIVITSDAYTNSITNADEQDYNSEEAISIPNETPYIYTNCHAKTYRPHKSTKYKNQASVHGDSWCDKKMDYIQTITHITRKRWYGLEKLSTDQKSASNRTRPKRHATPHHYCKGQGKYWYVGFSTHYAEKKLSARDTVIYNKTTKNEGTAGVSEFDC